MAEVDAWKCSLRINMAGEAALLFGAMFAPAARAKANQVRIVMLF